MLRALLLFTVILGASTRAHAVLMAYEGSGEFDDGVTFEFMFDWDGTVATPSNFSWSASDNSDAGSIIAASYGGSTPSDPDQVPLNSIVIDTFAPSALLSIFFTPFLSAVQNPVSISGLQDGSSRRIIVSGEARLSNATAVPEPATLALFGLGLAGLGISRRKRQTHS